MINLTLPIIGIHHSPLTQKFGLPRQPNLVPVASFIDFVPPFDTVAAFEGIDKFSHLWVLWQFHQNKGQNGFRPQVRPPRYGGNDKMGVFATRSMYRPSQIGMSVVRIDRIEIIDHRVRLHIIGADMVDGTPIIDIKPYIAFVDSITDAASGDIDVPSVKPVCPSRQAERDLADLIDKGALLPSDGDIIKELIAQDPRVAYRQAEIDVINTMRYKSTDVDFLMNDEGEMVIVAVRAV